MIQFMCPSCGKRVHGDDSFAGKHVICPECGQSVTLRRADAEATGITDSLPAFPTSSKQHVKTDDLPELQVKKSMVHFLKNLAPIAIVVLATFTFVGLLVCLLAPAAQPTRVPAARTQGTNNLKQIGLSMHMFHDTHKRLPFNGEVPAVAGDEKTGSWAFQILPFIDQEELFKNAKLFHGVQAYCCPKRARPVSCETGPWSDYCINPWLNDPKSGAVNAADRKLNLREVTDGTANTIFVGQGAVDPKKYGDKRAFPQSTDIFKGGDPALARRSTVNIKDARGEAELRWGGPFEVGTLFVFCDGTVRQMPYTITGGTIRNGVGDGGLAVFLTPAGNDVAVLPD